MAIEKGKAVARRREIGAVRVAPVDITFEQLQKYIPARHSEGAGGFDVWGLRQLDYKTRKPLKRPRWPVVMKPGQLVSFGLGLAIEVPPGYICLLAPRSGLAMEEILPANLVGVIDSDYRGQATVVLKNNSGKNFPIEKYTRIAQALFIKVEIPRLIPVPDVSMLSSTERGEGGFGSSGLGWVGSKTKLSDLRLYQLDQYMMANAVAASMRSDCVRGCKTYKSGLVRISKATGLPIGQKRRFGALIADEDTIIATGFNHVYPGCPKPCSEFGCMREREGIKSGTQLERCNAIHAEQDVVNKAAMGEGGGAGCTMYVTGETCLSCARMVAGLGLKAIVVLEGGYSSDAGLEIIRDSGTDVRPITMNPAYLRAMVKLALNPNRYE